MGCRDGVGRSGFINIRLTPEAKQQVVREVLAAGPRFGARPIDDSVPNKKLLVEFVSANPTGPLHVGHGRQAALGDAICNLFASQGWDVWREFYYNDAGVQIQTLPTQRRRVRVASNLVMWSGLSRRTTATTSMTSRRISWPRRQSAPMTAVTPPAVMSMISTASANSLSPTYAVNKILTCKRSTSNSIITTSSPACTPTAVLMTRLPSFRPR